jgi:hypothetical protein
MPEPLFVVVLALVLSGAVKATWPALLITGVAEIEPVHHGLHRGGEHVLVAERGVGGIAARERDARAADDDCAADGVVHAGLRCG